ncbi:MAG: hypothetical protein ACRCYU_00810 [Nocardioides sp.]
MQRERRRNPYPWTWEIPAAAITVVVVVVVAGIQLARGIANLLVGAGWTWPDTTTAGGVPTPVGTAFWTSLPNILAGDAGAGLAAPAPAEVAGPGLLWTCLALTQTLLLAATVGAGVYIYLRWGPGRMQGMATPAEAERLLGLTRLRKVAGIIRPDLYGRPSAHLEPVHHTAGGTEGVGEHPGLVLGRGLSPWLLDRRLTTRDKTKTGEGR